MNKEQKSRPVDEKGNPLEEDKASQDSGAEKENKPGEGKNEKKPESAAEKTADDSEALEKPAIESGESDILGQNSYFENTGESGLDMP